MYYKDISAQPYSQNTTNIDYVIDVIALNNCNNLSVLDSDFAAQKFLKSEWVFYWDESIRMRYSDSDKSFALSLSFRKWCFTASHSALWSAMIFEIVLQYVIRDFSGWDH